MGTETESEWAVPMTFSGRGTAFVKARTAEDALKKAEADDVEDYEIIETFDWDIDGHPSKNE